MVKLLFTGKRGFDYNRTQVLLAGLHKLDDVAVNAYEFKVKNARTASQLKSLSEQADYIFVPSFRYKDVAYVKKHTDKPIVFDPLISNYLTKVVDYGHYWKTPFKYLSDYFPFRKCDLLIADTEAHKVLYHRLFKVPLDKICVVPVGVNTSEFYPTDTPINSKFLVGFYGSYVPLQGTKKIVETARLLQDHKDIQFELIGGGAQFKEAKHLAERYQLQHLDFVPRVAYEKLSERVNRFDICLGIFGDSLKANSVIPNKIFHYAALAKPIITRNSAAVTEVFKHRKNIVLSTTNPNQIAEAILELKSTPELCSALGQEAYKTITEGFNEEKIAQKFVNGIFDSKI